MKSTVECQPKVEGNLSIININRLLAHKPFVNDMFIFFVFRKI